MKYSVLAALLAVSSGVKLDRHHHHLNSLKRSLAQDDAKVVPVDSSAAAEGKPVDSGSAAKDKEEDQSGLRSCPERPHGGMTMDQGRTHIIKYPNVGANCKAQLAQDDAKVVAVDSSAAAEGKPVDSGSAAKDKEEDQSGLRSCPARPHGGMTMDQGRTHIIKYPNVGANCKA